MTPGDLFCLSDKVVLVTGGGGGIGRALSLGLARAGAIVAVGDINAGCGRETVKLLRKEKGKGEAFRVDVSSPSHVKALVKKIIARYHRLDILVNNAGINIPCPTEKLSYTLWRTITDVNLTGVFLCAQAVGREMIKQREGVIIDIASIYGQMGSQLHAAAAYNSSKAGVINLTRSLAVEWAKHGIRVNPIAPGYVETRLIEKRLRDRIYVQKMVEQIPLGRICQPGDLVGPLIFLASRASEMVTGHVLNVDGGWLAV